MNHLITSLIEKIFPHYCLLCKDKSHSSLNLCESCQNDLPWLHKQGTICLYCSLPLTLPSLSDAFPTCAQCIINPMPYDRTFCLFGYQKPVTWLLTKLKFHQQLHYAPLLTQLMILYLNNAYPDKKQLPQCIVPVPLHPKRLRERGFNQALELAKPLASYFKIPLSTQNCQRIRATKTQSLSTAIFRKENMANAFNVSTLPAKYIAVVDDVMTTGYTLIELSKALREAGAERIDVWCYARTLQNF